MNTVRNLTSPRAVLAAALLLGACSSPKVVTLEHADADFEAYRTYGFAQELGTDESQYTTLLSRSLQEAARRELEQRGYRPSEDPDLVVDFHLDSRERLRVRPTPVPVFVYHPFDDLTGEGDYAVRFRGATEETLHVDLVDRHGRVVWEGVRTWRATGTDPRRRREAAEQALAEVLSAFPFEAGSAIAADVPGRGAFDEYRALARRGDPVAQFLLGVMYQGGHGVEQDRLQAAEWYRRAAEQGNALAQSNLGLMLLRGLGIPADEEEAVRLLRIAAEHGVAGAQYALASLHREGRGVPQDDRVAAGWLEQAAEQGLTVAQADLGLMLLRGQGVPRDSGAAATWFERAARKGFPRAQTRLGMMYEHGRGVPRDATQAVEWYRRAAEQGDPMAVERLERLGSPDARTPP